MSPTLIVVLVAVLGFVTVAGLGFALAGQDPSTTRTVKRAQAIAGRAEARNPKGRRAAVNVQDQRRKQILKTLRTQEKQQKKVTLALAAKLNQAGLGDSAKLFWAASAILGVVVLLLVMALGQPLWIAAALAFAAGLGLPRWVVGFLAKRRMGKFVAAFPDAIDIIVRGIKSGLPVHDCLRIIGRETPEPLAGEFKRLVENMSVGVSSEQALENLYQRMPTPEVRFFSIVLAIQQKTGGNLAEALGNLSSVIRARKLMREKVKALAGEAVASASIIGSLPPGVILMISILSPSYMAPMFSDPRGHLMLGVGAVWMGIGVFVMRRMINFKI